MNTISRTISGAVCLLLGFILGYKSFTLDVKEGFWALLAYGLALIILGVFIIFNKKEDEIEQVKTKVLKTKKSRKRV